MSDQEDDKKILNEDASQPEDENQPKIDLKIRHQLIKIKILRQLLMEMKLKQKI